MHRKLAFTFPFFLLAATSCTMMDGSGSDVAAAAADQPATAATPPAATPPATTPPAAEPAPAPAAPPAATPAAPAPAPAAPATPATTPPTASKTIAEVVTADPQFSTLLTALKAAGLDATLAEPGPFTVFAPTNDAFAKLPAGTLDNLLKPENKAQLTDLLKYHVISGSVPAATVVTLPKATSLLGKDIVVAVAGGKVTLNSTVNVTQTDIGASNGVIHVIDAVLQPPN